MRLKLSSSSAFDFTRLNLHWCHDVGMNEDQYYGNTCWVEFKSLNQFENFIKDNQHFCGDDEWVINLKRNELEIYNGYRD